MLVPESDLRRPRQEIDGPSIAKFTQIENDSINLPNNILLRIHPPWSRHSCGAVELWSCGVVNGVATATREGIASALVPVLDYGEKPLNGQGKA